MAASSKVNAIKQNAKLKQFIGWGVAIIFPLAAKGMIATAPLSIAAGLIYWLFCGLALRGILDTRLPYLNIKLSSIKKELVIILIFTTLGASYYFFYYKNDTGNVFNAVMGVLVFVIINGVVEPLVWANVYDLAGCRIKVSGYIAVVVNIFLMYSLFWSNYSSSILIGGTGNAVLILFQILILGLPVLIYEKSGDITIWSLQHVIYTMSILYSGGFDLIKLLHI